MAETLYSVAREEFSTLHQSSHGFATRVHSFATKTNALTRETPPAMQAKLLAQWSRKIESIEFFVVTFGFSIVKIACFDYHFEILSIVNKPSLQKDLR